MTPDRLADLHARCFTRPRPGSAAEFAALLDGPHAFLLIKPQGFLLGRVIVDEAEVLTLAVAPNARRRGIGARLMAGFIATAQARGATTAYLDVAADNAAALALYAAMGFMQSGQRRGYYTPPCGAPVDAVLLSRAL